MESVQVRGMPRAKLKSHTHSVLLGFHAASPEQFAEALQTVLTLSPDDELSMRWRARAWAVQRFSEEEFEKGWNQSGWRRWLLPL